MALVYADRVKETTTTTGTGTVNLAGAATGYRTFVSGVGSGNTCYYCITAGSEWEVGLGTVTSGSPDTLSRTTVIASSNAGALVTFSAGSKDVFLTAPGPKMPEFNRNEDGFDIAGGTTSRKLTVTGADSTITGAGTGVATIDSNQNVNLPSFQSITLTSTYTLTSQTAAQKLFNSSTNGAVTVLGSATYFFDGFYHLTSMSASSGSFGFALGGTATLASQQWQSAALKATTLTTAATMQTTFNTAANTTLVTASTATGGICHVWGKIIVTTGGTIIPKVSLGIAAAAVVGIGSYFHIWRAGSNSFTTMGAWS